MSWFLDVCLSSLLGALQVSTHLILSKTICSIYRWENGGKIKAPARWTWLEGGRDSHLRLSLVVSTKMIYSQQLPYSSLTTKISEWGSQNKIHTNMSKCKPQNLWISYVTWQSGIKVTNGTKDPNLLTCWMRLSR